jgi:hypothetical protein
MMFKPGDKIRALKDARPYSNFNPFVKGIVYSVKKVVPSEWYPSGFCVLVERDSLGSDTNGWDVTNFELAKPKRQLPDWF